MGNILVITDNLNAPPWYFCLDRYRHDIHWTGSGKNGEESKQVHFYFCKHIAAFCQASTQKQMHLHKCTKKPLKIQGFHRAADGNRTRDLRTTNATLYRLSHSSFYFVPLTRTLYILSWGEKFVNNKFEKVFIWLKIPGRIISAADGSVLSLRLSGLPQWRKPYPGAYIIHLIPDRPWVCTHASL